MEFLLPLYSMFIAGSSSVEPMPAVVSSIPVVETEVRFFQASRGGWMAPFRKGDFLNMGDSPSGEKVTSISCYAAAGGDVGKAGWRVPRVEFESVSGFVTADLSLVGDMPTNAIWGSVEIRSPAGRVAPGMEISGWCGVGSFERGDFWVLQFNGVIPD